MFTLFPSTIDKLNIFNVITAKINVFALSVFPVELKLKHKKYAGENKTHIHANTCRSKKMYGTIIIMDIQKHSSDNTFTK